MITLSPVLASASDSLVGNPWLALLTIVGLIVIFTARFAFKSRWLAASHSSSSAALPSAANFSVPLDAIPSATSVSPVAQEDRIPPEHLAIIAAVVRITFGPGAAVADVSPAKLPTSNFEILMSQWSMEGRRQIYSSHNLR